MKNNNAQVLIKGTWILSVSSLITKILSAFYRVPLQNLVGDRGFYVYQQVYPLYGLCTAVALTGIPMFVSQVLAESSEQSSNNRRYLLIGAIILGILGAVVLKILAFPLASWMGDSRLAPLIKALSWFYLLAPLEAVYRGIYQADLQMLPTALSQVSEQIVRVVIIIAAAVALPTEYYQMSTWAHAGSGVGALTALIILVSFKLPQTNAAPTVKPNLINLGKRFITEGLMFSLFGSLLVLFQTIDSFTMYKLLSSNNWTNPQVLKGIYDRGQPLAQLGVVVAISFATAILPQLSRRPVAKQQTIISSTIHVTLTLAASSAVGMAVLMPQINTLLFQNSRQSLTLAIYVLSVVFVAYAMVLNTIMQAQHYHQQNFRELFLVLVLKWAANLWLIPHLGPLGASIATLLASFLLAVLLYYKASRNLQKILIQKGFLKKLVLIMLFLAGFVAVLSMFWRLIEPLTRLTALWEVSLTIVLAVLIVVILSYHWQLLTLDEWDLVPGGSWILKMLGGKHALR